jgi:CRP-like cAMP-binding protein
MADAKATYEGANRLLAALPRRDYRRLAAALEPVALNRGEVLAEAGEAIRSVYFLEGGLVSVLLPLEGKKVAEVAVIGREGMVGLPALLGADSYPHRAVVHVPGSALRLPAKALRDGVRRHPALGEGLLRYAAAFFVQVSQSAVCNCLHRVQQRYCRWLLLAHDRVGSPLPLTLRYLALMLTVRLASVSEATHALVRARLIRYRRGQLDILDRPGLEAAACTCYRRIQDYFGQEP